ncbi:hypothetical protein WAI453_002909 [Rhynchosporium graminicola]
MTSSRSFPLYDKKEDIHRSIAEIFDLERDPRAPFSLVQGYTDHHQHHASNDESEEGLLSRTTYLKDVLPVITHLWLSGSEHLDLAADKLADASREARWRLPIGDSGTLEFFLEILPFCDNRRDLRLQSLRLIGNACADVDQNRTRLLSRNTVPCVIQYLKDPFLSTVAVVVLYNVCVDFVPAQRIASEHNLTQELVQQLSGGKHGKAFHEHCCELLALMTTQEVEIQHAPSDIGLSLLSVAASEGVETIDDFSNLLSAALLYLQQQKSKQALIEQDGMTTALALVTKYAMRLEGTNSYSYELNMASQSPSTSQERAATQLAALGQIILEISSLPEFSVALYPLDSPFGAALFHLLASSRAQFQNYACVLLGNLARSDRVSEELVHTYQVLKPLTAILKSTHDSKLLFAALSLLNNLALLPRNNAEMGNTGLLEFLPMLWVQAEKLPVQHASIRLTRILLVGNWDNVRRFYRRLSRDKNSPAHMRSNMSLLLAIFHRTENETTKIEISRLITAFCRVGSQRMPNDAQKLEQNIKKFYFMHPELGKSLVFMITQQKSAIVRSEGWFTLALLAATPEGAACIFGVLSEDGGMQALVETLRGKSIVDGEAMTPGWPQWIDQFMGDGWDWASNTQAALPSEEMQVMRMANIDRKNARAILRVLINSGLDSIDSLQLSLYEDLLNTGSP